MTCAGWVGENRNAFIATNGGTLAVIGAPSRKGGRQDVPDLFYVRAPAAFRGYYWNGPTNSFGGGWGKGRCQEALELGSSSRLISSNHQATVRLISRTPSYARFVSMPSERHARKGASGTGEEVEKRDRERREGFLSGPHSSQKELDRTLERATRTSMRTKPELVRERRGSGALMDAVRHAKVNCPQPEVRG